MPDLMRHHLGAYLDGELHGPALQAMQAHLARCAECRQELQALQQLSQTLQNLPLPNSLPDAGEFTARLTASLPPQPSQTTWQTPLSLHWLIPLGLLSSLALLHVTVLLSNMLTFSNVGLSLTQAGSWLEIGLGQNLWWQVLVSALHGALSSWVDPAWLWVADLLRGLQTWFAPLRWTIAAALLYLAWLAFWFSSRQTPNGVQALAGGLVVNTNGF